MLVLSRKKGESVVVGDDVTVTVIEIRMDKVRLGFNYPNHLPVHRTEVYEAIRSENARTTGLPGQSSPAPPPQLQIDPQQPLESLRGHLRTLLGESQFDRILPLLDQLSETKTIAVR